MWKIHLTCCHGYLNIFLKLGNAEATTGKNQEMTAPVWPPTCWPLSKNASQIYRRATEPYASWGESHLLPTGGANSEAALGLEKPQAEGETSWPSACKSVCCAYSYKPQTCISKSQKLWCNFRLYDLKWGFHSNCFRHLWMTTSFTHINVCPFQQQELQYFELPAIRRIMKRFPSTF